VSHFSASHMLYVRVELWLVQDGAVPRFEVGESYPLTLDLQPKTPTAPAQTQLARIDPADRPEGPFDPGPYYNILGRVSWRPKDSANPVVLCSDELFFGLNDPSLAPEWEWVTVLGTIDVQPNWLSVVGGLPEVTRSFTVGRVIREFTPSLPPTSDITQDISDWSRYRSEEATRAEPWLFDSRDSQLRRYVIGIWPS
jgi:hypothetical protein